MTKNNKRRRQGPAQQGPPGRIRASSRPRLEFNPGPWALNWRLADYEVEPFGWPDLHDPWFGRLAAFLARLNTKSLDHVMTMQRASTTSANHDVDTETLIGAAQERWAHLFEAHKLDQEPYGDVNLTTLSYCLREGDSRRVWVVLDSSDRQMFPLWWDPDHVVSGQDDRSRGPGQCTDECLHDRDEP